MLEQKAPVPESLSALAWISGRGDAEITRLARLQQGLVHRRQLFDAGLTQDMITLRLATGRLTKICHGVYAPGDRRPDFPMTAEMIAVLRFQGYGVLSGVTAAKLWGITDLEPKAVQLTLIGCTRRTPPAGVQLTQVVTLHPSELRRRQGFPVTSPARTWVDLARYCSADECESALAIARRHNLVRDSQIWAVIERMPANKQGINLACELLSAKTTSHETRSTRERKLLALLDEAGIPRPLTNVQVEGHMVDCYWPDAGLVVEFDSWQFHQGRKAFETDRLRDQDLTAAGLRVQRVTARQMDDHPLAVIARLASARAHGAVAASITAIAA